MKLDKANSRRQITLPPAVRRKFNVRKRTESSDNTSRPVIPASFVAVRHHGQPYRTDPQKDGVFRGYVRGQTEQRVRCVSQTNLGEEIARRLNTLPAVQSSPLPLPKTVKPKACLPDFRLLPVPQNGHSALNLKADKSSSGLPDSGDGGYGSATIKKETLVCACLP